MKNIELCCDKVFNIQESNQYQLAHFTVQNISVKSNIGAVENTNFIKDLVMKKVNISKE